MNKQTFLTQLRKKLSGLPQEEIADRLTFYREMIEDRMEEGLPEEDAVSAVGSIDEIASHILGEASAKTTKISKPSKGLKAWEIVLLILGSPIWLSLLIALFAVGLSLYAVLWSVIISLWAVFFSVAACTLVGIVAGIGFIWGGYKLSGIAMIGAGIACAGLSIFLFYGCKMATKGVILLTKKLILGMCNRLQKKEEA